MPTRHIFVCPGCHAENAFVEPTAVRSHQVGTADPLRGGREETREYEERTYACAPCGLECTFDEPAAMWRAAESTTVEDLRQGALEDEQGLATVDFVETRLPQGVHARPAHLIVREIVRHEVRVGLTRPGKAFEFDATSIVEIMMLAITQGSLVRLRCVGKDAEAVRPRLLSLLQGHEH